jgi:hypothetical protein
VWSKGRQLESPFREDLWFAQGKGLVRLVQTVNGETSMVWTLDAR